MTVRDLPRSEFLASLPDQLRSAFVVFLVNADPDTARVASDAWAVAASLAAAQRRTCLVDLSVTRPLLTPQRPAPEGEGIVDAFLYGASLQRVAVEQDPPGLFVIAAGTHTDQPQAVWRHVRWGRLARGFAAEGAVLMLLGPVEAMAAFPTTPDIVVLLSASGVQPTGRTVALAEAGVPVVRVIPDAPVPAAAPAPARERLSAAAAVRPRRALGRWWLAAAGVVVLGGAGAFAVLGGPEDGISPPAPAARTSPPRATQADATPLPTGGDSLFYTVQVAAFTSPQNALERAAEYWDAGWTATVSPVRLGRQGTWHRLVVGALPGPLEAEATLEGLWADGLLERPNGTILRTPLALEVATGPDSASAEAALAGVRAAGSAGYIVRALDGTYRILVGAFETPEQAARADSILDTTDLQGMIVRRAGIAR